MQVAAAGRRRFAGFAPSAFAFFAELAADNNRAWFSAHRDRYRREVDRPWRLLLQEVAPAVQALAPEADTAVKTGRVISRINLQWPREGAAYRTGLTATFAPRDGRRGRPEARLFVALDASGVRAGAEVMARTEAWRRLQERLRTAQAAWFALGTLALGWTVAGRPLERPDPPSVSERMAALRSAGSLRAVASWAPAAPPVAEPRLAALVAEALRRAAPVFLAAILPAEAEWARRIAALLGGGPTGAPRGGAARAAVGVPEGTAPGPEAGDSGATPSPAPDGRAAAPPSAAGPAPVPVPPPAAVGPASEAFRPRPWEGPEHRATAGAAPEAAAPPAVLVGFANGGGGGHAPSGPPLAGLPVEVPALPVQVRLPRSLRLALVRRAAEEGVSPEAFVAYALTRALEGCQ